MTKTDRASAAVWCAVMLAAALVAALAPAAAQPQSQPLSGQASVIDGDTIEIHGQRIRLYGIDAPESRQLCTRPSGETWRCGQNASFALADEIGQATIRCEYRDRDRYRRIVAVCFKANEDLNRWMVANGWAVAYRRYSLDYVADEEVARKARTNIWSGSFELPWDWRRQKMGR